MQNVLQYNGKFYVCGTGRQTLVRSKTSNDNYYLLTMAAIAQEIHYRRGERKADVVLAAGLPLIGQVSNKGCWPVQHSVISS